MILFLMQTANINYSFDFLSEPLGVLLFAGILIGGAIGLRRILLWNEAMARRAQELTEELLEKTVG